MNRARIFVVAASAAALALAGCAPVEETIVEKTTTTYKANLTGAQEVGGGDTDGSGSAEVSISDNFDQVCWDLNDIRNIGPITGAHIHRGALGVNGPVVFPFRQNNVGDWQGCSDAREWTADRIENNAGAFYVNVHTAQYPNGAIRGQLSRN